MVAGGAIGLQLRPVVETLKMCMRAVVKTLGQSGFLFENRHTVVQFLLTLSMFWRILFAKLRRPY